MRLQWQSQFEIYWSKKPVSRSGALPRACENRRFLTAIMLLPTLERPCAVRVLLYFKTNHSSLGVAPCPFRSAPVKPNKRNM